MTGEKQNNFHFGIKVAVPERGEVFETECIVVGAGVIGLAGARRLALNGREVVVLERAGI